MDSIETQPPANTYAHCPIAADERRRRHAPQRSTEGHYSPGQTAALLSVSAKTVKSHRMRIMQPGPVRRMFGAEPCRRGRNREMVYSALIRIITHDEHGHESARSGIP